MGFLVIMLLSVGWEEHKMKKLFSLIVFVFVVFAVGAWAQEALRLEAPLVVMRGDSPHVFWVSDGQEQNPVNVVFSTLPVGVSVAPTGASRGEGRTSFHLIVDDQAPLGPFLLQAQRTTDPRVVGGVFITIEPTVSRFVVSPLKRTSPQRGQPIGFQVLAVDEAGAVVTSYRDSVDVRASFGQVNKTVIPGELFKNGVALVELTFTDSDPLTQMNRLELKAQNLYPGQSEHAMGDLLLSLPSGSHP